MIETQRAASDDGENGAEQAPRFHIERAWYDEHHLSFEDVVRARVCESCRAKFGQEVEERVPKFDKGTGKMQFEMRKVAYGSDPVKVIREHCGRAKGYIAHDMPTLEAVFRVVLLNGNQPMSLQQVREQLAEWCPGGGCQWLLMPMEMLERLVRNDRYYGLRENTAAPAAAA